MFSFSVIFKKIFLGTLILFSISSTGILVINNAHAATEVKPDEKTQVETCPEDVYCLLEPLPGMGEQVNTNQGIGAYLNQIIKFVIGFAGALAVIMMVVGGIQYMSTDAMSGKEDGKEMIQNALIGLGLALCSFLLLYTIDPNLTHINLEVPKVSVEVDDFAIGDGPITTSAGSGKTGTGAQVCEKTTKQLGDTWPGQDGAERKQLSDLGIQVTGTNGACKTTKDTKCTTVYGLDKNVITSLGNIKKSCGTGCNVVLTGGTECWQHASHGPGLSSVDLRHDAKLDTYIKNKYPYSGQGKWGAASNAKFYGNGPAVVDEGDHWHLHRNWTVTSSANNTSNSNIIKGMDWKGQDPYPDNVWTNTKPELQKAFDDLNQIWTNKNKALTTRQVYRPNEYAKHIRYIWEYDRLMQNKTVLYDLYGCENFQHLEQKDADALTGEQKTTIKKEIEKHANYSKGPACTSDHGSGIAFDLGKIGNTQVESLPSNLFNELMDDALSVGLCHNIENDRPHFTLKKYLPSGVNCKTI